MSASIPRKGETIEQCLERRRQEWANNSSDLNQQRRFLYPQSKDGVNAKRREKEAQNRQAVRDANRLSYIRNSEQRCLDALKNHKLRKLRIPVWSETQQIKEFYLNCPTGMVVDHVIPLLGKLASGLHVLNNLQYLTPEENTRKLNKFEVQ